MRRVLLVGDTVGVPRALRHLDRSVICGLIGAAIRPQQHTQLHAIASALGVPFVIQPPFHSAAYGEFVNAVAGLEPDLMLCDSYSMLLRDDLLAIPPCGAVNVHGALLPRYRGANPIQWMIVNDEHDAGVTIHWMDGGFDSGDVIAQRRVQALFTDTWADVLERVSAATDQLLAEQLPRILDGSAPRKTQDPAEARHFPRRHPSDGRIDWSRPVREIYNLVRALVRPLPGAFYVHEGKTVTLDEYLSVADVALLKQEMIGGRWQAPGAGSLQVDASSSQDSIALEVCTARGDALGGAVVDRIDYSGRSADLRATAPSAVEPARNFAMDELGLIELRTEVV